MRNGPTLSHLFALLRELGDQAYFANALIAAAAHNMSVVSYQWRFPAVVSVGSHPGSDPLE